MAAAQQFIIADDHPLFRSALKNALQSLFNDATTTEAQDIESLQVALEAATDTDLILLDLHMPGAQGFSALIHLCAQHPEIPVLVVSASETPETMCRALDHGAAGFLPKSSGPEAIEQAISAVLAGDRWLPEGVAYQPGAASADDAVTEAIATLTPQQFRVASQMSQGLLNKQIAYELGVTEATVKAHVTEIFRKLGVHSRTQAVLLLSQLEIEDGDREP